MNAVPAIFSSNKVKVKILISSLNKVPDMLHSMNSQQNKLPRF